jgi:hypothetical protein
MGRKVPLPPHVRATLYRLFGDAVDLVEIVEHSWFTKLHGRAHATTRRRRIYLRGSAADFFDDPVLMLHEYFHVLRQWEPRELSVATCWSGSVAATGTTATRSRRASSPRTRCTASVPGWRRIARGSGQRPARNRRVTPDSGNIGATGLH